MKPYFSTFTISFIQWIFFLLVNTNNCAQGIQIGEKCPDIEINRIINYSSEKAKLSDFKGKPLLIDFWFSTCTACIESFPKLDSFRNIFENKLQILLVNHESEEKVRMIFKKVKLISGIKLPTVVNDSILRLLFPHNSAPHEIWIDKNGFVQAITGQESVTKENLIVFSEGDSLNLPLKKDNLEYSNLQPLIKSANGDSLIQYSCLTQFQPGISGSLGIIPPMIFNKNRIQVRGINISIKELYKLAYNKWKRGKNFHVDRVILEIPDMKLDKLAQFNKTKKYCYDLIMSDTSETKALRYMREEIDKFFDIKSTLEKRKVKCLVLQMISPTKQFAARSVVTRGAIYNSAGKLIVDNVELIDLIENTLNYGNDPWAPFQLIDESGFKGKVDLVLPSKFTNLSDVNKSLHQFAFELIEEEREMDVIILRNNKE